MDCLSKGLIFAMALMLGSPMNTCAQGIHYERALTANKPQKIQRRRSTPCDVSYKELYEEQLQVAEELRSILKKAQDLLGQAAPLDQPVSATCDEYNSGKGFAPGCIVVPRANLTGFGEDYCLNPYPMGSGFLGTLQCSEDSGTCYYLPCCTSSGENPCVIPTNCTASSKSIDPFWNIIFPDYEKSVKYEPDTETCSSVTSAPSIAPSKAPCVDTKGKFLVNNNKFTCKKVARKKKKLCKKKTFSIYCPITCNKCDDKWPPAIETKTPQNE